MAEELGDKTEAPTPRRRLEARQQGNIARSHDLTSSVLLLGMLLMLNWYGEGLVLALRGVMDRMLGPASMGDFNAIHAVQGFSGAIAQVGRAMMPFFIGAMLIAVMVNLAQVGLFFNTTRLTGFPSRFRPYASAVPPGSPRGAFPAPDSLPVLLEVRPR